MDIYRETYGPEPPPIQQTGVTKKHRSAWWGWLIIAAIATIIALVALGCASTGQRLADVAKPNPVLPAAALECAKLPMEASQRTCLQGVLAEAERAGNTASAAALAVALRRGYPYDYYGSGYGGYGGTYGGGGYRGVIPYP